MQRLVLVVSRLADERERRAAFLLYCCGLNPKEIITPCHGEFIDARKIYWLNVIILERLQNNTELHQLLNDQER